VRLLQIEKMSGLNLDEMIAQDFNGRISWVLHVTLVGECWKDAPSGRMSRRDEIRSSSVVGFAIH
jgi:hypothetical protein